MNRYLLAGASALALTVGASAANAQFTLTTSGDLWVDTGYSTMDPASGALANALNVGAVQDSRNTEMVQRGRFNLIWTQKSDSGLTYGARYRVRLGPSAGPGVDYDKAFIFVNGSFGQVSLGVNSGLADQWAASASAWGTGGADGNYGDFLYNNVAGGTLQTPSARAFGIYGELANDNRTRLWYQTPSFSGFNAGVSYMPVFGGADRGRGFEWDNNAATFSDVIQVGLNYDNTFDALRVRGFVTYSWGSGRGNASALTNTAGNVTATKDLSAFAVNLRLDYGAFAVSGHYVNNGESGQTRVAGAFLEDQVNYGILGQYTVSPALTIGASYGYYEDGGSTTVRGKDKQSIWSVGAAYTLAPGLTIRPEYSYVDFDNEGTQPDKNGNVFIVRTQVLF